MINATHPRSSPQPSSDDGRAHSASRPLTCALGLVIAILALSAAPACAEITHKYESQITGPSLVEPFGDPWGLAFDSSGDLLVADAELKAIDVFDPENTFSPPQLTSPALREPYTRSVAVAASGDLYVGESGPEDVDVFKSEGAGAYGLVEENHLGGYVYVAVDNHPLEASDPRAGDVYVLNGAGPATLHVYKPGSEGRLGPQVEEKVGLTITSAGTGGLAVDAATGTVYVANPENHAVDVFNDEGEEQTPITASDASSGTFTPIAVATDDAPGEEGIFVIDEASNAVDQFSRQRELQGQITHTEVVPGEPQPLGQPHGVAVREHTGPGNSDVYVSDDSAKAVYAFGPGVQVTHPEVDSGAATARQPTAVTLNGDINARGVALTQCEFEYVSQAAFEQTAYKDLSSGGTVPCTPSAGSIPADSSKHAVTAAVSGLTQGETYHFRLVGANAGAATHGEDRSFTTSTAPAIDAPLATNISATTVDLTATVNPDNGDTTYHFEYGQTTSYGISIPVPDGDLGEGHEDIAVAQHLSGLLPNTTYHWRLVAKNAAGTTTSVDHTFNYSTAHAELPDHRAYEMVTPPFKDGALIGNCLACSPPVVSNDGSRVIAEAIQCFAESESCTGFRSHNGEPFEFARTPGGWTTTPLAPPATQFSENTPFKVSADEGSALFSMPTGPAGEDEWYTRSAGGSFRAIGPASPPGTTGDLGFNLGTNVSTGNLSHLVWSTSSSGPFWPFDDETLGGEDKSVYEYVGAGNARPFLVGVTGHQESTELLSTCRTQLGGPLLTWNAMSADGRTVYFTAGTRRAGEACPGGSGTNEHTAIPVGELYARVDGESATARTAPISEPQAPQVPASAKLRQECASGPCIEHTSAANEDADWREAAFLAASNDGSRVLFTSKQQLTDKAAQDEGDNLYLSQCQGCEGLSESEELVQRRLIDVSEGSAGPVVGGPEVQGLVAFSSDGTHVYFVAKGKLTGEEENQDHEKAMTGADNLYVYSEHRLAFITTLSPSDHREWEFGNSNANVTPDGHYLLFTSRRALTPDDTRPEGPAQAYRYDEQAATLTRISIGNDGYNDNGNAGSGEVTIVPPNGAYSGPPRGDPTMSDDGSYIFFQSPVALTPHALDDVVAGKAEHFGELVPFYAQNVYEYHEGHVYLISDGRDANSAGTPCQARFVEEEAPPSAVCLLGVDATGHNAFFMTTAHLAAKDTDTQVDIYDARICEPDNANPCISEGQPPGLPCSGEECHGIPAGAPAAPEVPSASFNGAGNISPGAPPAPKGKTAAQARAAKLAKALKACRRKHGKRRAACERHAGRKYGRSKAKKATTKRGAK